MFRSFTGEAIQLLKAGNAKEEAIQELWKLYVEEHERRGKECRFPEMQKPEKRIYRKNSTSYAAFERGDRRRGCMRIFDEGKYTNRPA